MTLRRRKWRSSSIDGGQQGSFGKSSKGPDTPLVQSTILPPEVYERLYIVSGGISVGGSPDISISWRDQGKPVSMEPKQAKLPGYSLEERTGLLGVSLDDGVPYKDRSGIPKGLPEDVYKDYIAVSKKIGVGDASSYFDTDEQNSTGKKHAKSLKETGFEMQQDADMDEIREGTDLEHDDLDKTDPDTDSLTIDIEL